jgi:hypothetical protein
VIVTKELSTSKLNLVGVHKVTWEGGGTELAGECTFFYGKGNGNHELGTVCFVHNRSISTVKRVDFFIAGQVADVMSLSWTFNPKHQICGDVKDTLYKDLERVFHVLDGQSFGAVLFSGGKR